MAGSHFADRGLTGPEPSDPGIADLGFARVDTDRERRQGLPEVVYGPGKTVTEIVAIVRRLLDRNCGPVLVTRAEPHAATDVLAEIPDGRYDESSRLLIWRAATAGDFRLGVVTAGTTDGTAAREAAAVAAAIGMRVRLICDVGVAGIHRLLAVTDELATFDAVVVVAGMEAALASVVGGLVACPVIAVPTSTGYGASLHGVTALLGMLSACAPGIAVVNIDSGFGAAMAAYRLMQVSTRRR